MSQKGLRTLFDIFCDMSPNIHTMQANTTTAEDTTSVAQLWDIFFFLCISFAVHCVTERMLPPQDVSSTECGCSVLGFENTSPIAMLMMDLVILCRENLD